MSRLETTPEVQAPEVGPADAGRLLSADEFAAARFDRAWHYERVEGRLRIMSPDGWEHVGVSEPWRDRLGAYALARPDLIRRVVSHAWIRVGPDDDRIADIGVYLATGAADRIIPDLVPDLAFEFVSPTRADRERDYVAKRAEYQAIGVREYVIVDRFDRRVTVLTLAGGAYAERVIPAAGTYRSDLVPGFAIDLAAVWPR